MLVHCWFTVGQLLVPCWSPVGPLLVPCWSPVGPLLVHCWSTIGPLLVHCWSTSCRIICGEFIQTIELELNRDSTSRVRVFKNIPRGVIEQEGGRGQGVKVQEVRGAGD